MISRLELKERHYSHSQTEEPRTDMISSLGLQQGTTVTHILESKDRHDQQARITVKHHSHSLSGESRTGMISRVELQQGTTVTHFLESQGQA